MSDIVMILIQCYVDGVVCGEWQDDLVQYVVLVELDCIYIVLVDSVQDGWLDWLLVFWKRFELVKGLYFWGGVGWGKIFLVDLFYDGLLIEQKYCIYFYCFMCGIYECLCEYQGQSDLLVKIVQEWCSRLCVLVLDEFFVIDIGDVMLLVCLFECLFVEGVILVIIFNMVVENLYFNGLQCDSFMLVIGLLQIYCVELYVEGIEDYCMCVLICLLVYWFLCDVGSDVWLVGCWVEFSGGMVVKLGNIEIEVCKILVCGCGKSIVWFDFMVLCEGLCGLLDYIEIVYEFNIVLLGDILYFDMLNEDVVCCFVNLIDELYDCYVNLVCIVSDFLVVLYLGVCFQGVFECIVLWLIEMQSVEYFGIVYCVQLLVLFCWVVCCCQGWGRVIVLLCGCFCVIFGVLFWLWFIIIIVSGLFWQCIFSVCWILFSVSIWVYSEWVWFFSVLVWIFMLCFSLFFILVVWVFMWLVLLVNIVYMILCVSDLVIDLVVCFMCCLKFVLNVFCFQMLWLRV